MKMRRFSPLRRLGALRRDRKGNATIQVVMMVPLLIAVSSIGFELGMITLRQAMMDRAVDLEVRSIRVGTRSSSDYEGLRTAICERAMIIPECEQRMKLELVAMDPYTWETPQAEPDCEALDKVTVTDPRQFDDVTGGQLVVLRACAVVQPIFPGMHLGARLLSRPDGGRNVFFQIEARSAFVREPT